MLKATSTLTILSLLPTLFCSANLKPIETKDAESATPKMRHIATADGKHFFAEFEPKRTWKEAYDHCKSVGTHLTTITTVKQQDALRNSWSPFFNQDYWVAGRDAQTLKQFAWHQTEEELPEIYSLRVLYWNEFETCVNDDTHKNFDAHLVSRPCLELNGNLPLRNHQTKDITNEGCSPQLTI